MTSAAVPSVPGLPDGPLDLRDVRIDAYWALRVPPSLALRRRVLPFACVGGEVWIAAATAPDDATTAAVARHVERPVRVALAEPESLRRALQRVYSESAPATEGDDPVGLCAELLYAAWIRGASDVHVDPSDRDVRIRLRVDGQLEEYRRLPLRVHPELVSRIKVLGGMDIAERRAPQDGRFTHEFGAGERGDVRVATLPTKHGERVTMRLLAVHGAALSLASLGMQPEDLAVYERAIARPHGLLLATGPTGSGKTTTLYAALRRILDTRSVNAITVQDPVEYDIEGAAQVEVDTAQKVTFAKALRAILRHDPDVLMIGEIRDRETADIALKAALTGHLVLATLHTNSAASAVTRLHDMGVERFLTAATLTLVVAQRLVRRLCRHCSVPVPLDPVRARLLRWPASLPAVVREPRGCLRCAGRGYDGRIGLFELFAVDEGTARAIAAGATEPELIARQRAAGVRDILDDAVGKLAAGTTSLGEVLDAVHPGVDPAGAADDPRDADDPPGADDRARGDG